MSVDAVLQMHATEVLKRYVDFDNDGLATGETVTSATCVSSTPAAATVSASATCSGTQAAFTITGVAAGATTITVTAVTSNAQTLVWHLGVGVT